MFLTYSTAQIVDTIFFVGNERSSEKFLLRIIEPVASWVDYQPQKIDSLISFRLLETGLFNTVTITPAWVGRDTVTLFVAVHEANYFAITDLGGSIKDREYGEPTRFPWIEISTAISYTNFLGWGHTLTVSGSVWRMRHIGVTWLIPFRNSAYYSEISAKIGRKTSQEEAWQIRPFVDAEVLLGRYIKKNHLISVGISPQYREYHYMKQNNSDEWVSYKVTPLAELFSSVRYTMDYRDPPFDPLSGNYLRSELRTNVLMPALNEIGEKTDFVELHFDYRHFIPISHQYQHTVALRARTSLTPYGDHAVYDRFEMGGDGTLRGFSEGALGEDVIYNNRFLATLEYRLHIMAFSVDNLKFVNEIHKDPLELAAAVFSDFGYLWKDIKMPMADGEHSTGASVGVSLRLLTQTFRTGVSLDLAWPVFLPANYTRNNRWIPTIHLYINLPF